MSYLPLFTNISFISCVTTRFCFWQQQSSPLSNIPSDNILYSIFIRILAVNKFSEASNCNNICVKFCSAQTLFGKCSAELLG